MISVSGARLSYLLCSEAVGVRYLESAGIADSIVARGMPKPKVLCMDKLTFDWKRIS